MVIRDIYLLRKSDEFYLESGHEASINLSLEKVPPSPCTKLCGQVLSGCEPISGATVKILDKNFNPLCHTDTDNEGKFSFINTLMPGVYEIIAVADDYQVSQSRLISLMPYKPLYVTIELRPDKRAESGTVYGTIRDEKNEPLPGTQVYISVCNDVEFPVAITISNSDGEYLVYGLKTGKYVISAFKEGYLMPQSINLSLFPREIARADLYLYKDTALKGTVSGKVTHNGSAVPDALTALYLTENGNTSLIQVQKSNDMGFYLFSGLKPGFYIVKAKLESEYIPLRTNVVF